MKAVLTVPSSAARARASARLRGVGCTALCDHVWLNRTPYAWALALLVAVAVFSSAVGKTSADRLCGEDDRSYVTTNGACVRDGSPVASGPPSR